MEEKERGSYPSDLTDEQWEEIAPLYTGMRNCTWSKRELTDAVLYLVDSGCKWRQLPHDFPPYSTVHSFYRRARIRACLKIVNTPNRRAFFRRAALLCLEIHKVFLRQIALPGEKIPCRWAYCQFSNGAYTQITQNSEQFFSGLCPVNGRGLHFRSCGLSCGFRGRPAVSFNSLRYGAAYKCVGVLAMGLKYIPKRQRASW